MKFYWGDIHNHCSASYGNGTPDRALDVAKSHLDFCSITGHAFWPDMPMDLITQDKIIHHHLGGFNKLQYYWDELLEKQERAQVKGKFVTLPSYEWHSMEFGDHNCYFNAGKVPLIDGPTVAALAKKLKRRDPDFMILPHHVGYPRGYRGCNWDAFSDAISPLVEIYSNHGSGEADDSYYEYLCPC